MSQDEEILIPAQTELFDASIFKGDALLSEEQLKEIENDEQRGDFIAARLKKKRPDTYALICMCRANGLSIKKTMKIASVGFNTVVEIDRLEKDYIQKCKDVVAKEAFGIASMIVDSMRDHLPKILASDALSVEDAKSLTDILSKLVTNANLLTGNATEIIGVDTSNQYTNWRDWEKEDDKK